MKTVEETIDLAVPVRTAYNQWTQFESFPRFMTVVKDVDQIRPNLTRWVIGRAGCGTNSTVEIVEQEPDSHVAWREPGPAFYAPGRFRSARRPRTAPTSLSACSSAPRSGTSSPGSQGSHSRVVHAELGHFKEFIEVLGQEGGAWRGTIRNGHV